MSRSALSTGQRRRTWLLIAVVAMSLGACRGDIGIEANLDEGLSHLGVRLSFDGVAAEVLAEESEVGAAIIELLAQRVGVNATAVADGEKIVFAGTAKVPAANVTTASGITGVKAVALDGEGRLIVHLTQPTELVSAIIESSGGDESLVNTILETTSVTVYITGAEGATLDEGNAGDTAFSGSHLAVSRPLARNGEDIYIFALPGVDPIVVWGLGITGVVVAAVIGAAVWRRRR